MVRRCQVQNKEQQWAQQQQKRFDYDGFYPGYGYGYGQQKRFDLGYAPRPYGYPYGAGFL